MSSEIGLPAFASLQVTVVKERRDTRKEKQGMVVRVGNRGLLAQVGVLALAAVAAQNALANDCSKIDFGLLHKMDALERFDYIEKYCVISQAGLAEYKAAANEGNSILRIENPSQRDAAINAAQALSNIARAYDVAMVDYKPSIARAIAREDYKEAYDILAQYETAEKLLRGRSNKLAEQFLGPLPPNPVAYIVGTAKEALSGVPDMYSQLNNRFTQSLWGNFVTGFVINFKDEGDIKNASVEPTASGLINTTTGGIVRLNTDNNDKKAGVALFAHTYPLVWKKETEDNKHVNWAVGLGPYVSIMPTAEDVVDVLGVGISIGVVGNPNFKAGNNLRTSLNFNFGYFLDFDALRVKNGFEDNQKLTDASTLVEIEEYTDEGFQFGISFSVFTK